MDRAKLLGPSCGVQAAAAICERVADPAPGYHQDSGAEGLRMSEAASSSLLKFFQWSLFELRLLKKKIPKKTTNLDFSRCFSSCRVNHSASLLLSSFALSQCH